jgi:hypothetical protein
MAIHMALNKIQMMATVIKRYKNYTIIIGLILATLSFSSSSNAIDLNDAVISKQIISESIGAYSGNCPCPYNLARNGSQCGKRSAYNRAGGASPLCFESDITAQMIAAYRNLHNTKSNK